MSNSERPRMFSESWHRVADLAVALNPAVEVYKQHYRGELWYVLRDPLNNEFYRLTPSAYAFVGRLDEKRSVEEVWRKCLELDPDAAPGQEEVIQLLAQLHRSNLLLSPLPPESVQIFERYRKARAQKVRSQLVNFLFVHIPLYDPNRLLDRLRPVGRVLFGPLGAIAWIVVVLLALKTVVENYDMAVRESANIFAPENLALLYACTVFTKLFHEFGHGMACERFGGEVHTFGIMLMVFAPLPYLDVTSSWAFRSRYQRVLVGAGGMISEFFVAGIATMVWSNTGSGLLHDAAFLVMFVASVSTIIFNANPLLRFDGYYIFSDLMDLPNLYQRATRQLKHLSERYLFGVKASFTPARDRRELGWLTGYGIVSFAYRVFLLGAITFLVAESFFGLGIALAVAAIAAYFVLPLAKFVRYLFTSARLGRVRARAMLVTGVAVVSVLGLLWGYPMPRHFRAPGVVQSAVHSRVYTATEGLVDSVFVASGATVVEGQPLLRMRNPEIRLQIEAARAREKQIAAQAREVRQRRVPEMLRTLAREREAVQYLIGELGERERKLTIVAAQHGVWVSAQASTLVGQWLPKGVEVGQLIDPARMSFVAVVAQDEAANLFAGGIRHAEVRLNGNAQRALTVSAQDIVPVEKTHLPSAALGQRAGGEVAVRRDDPAGLRTAESFYEIEVGPLSSGDGAVRHHRSGQIRFTLDSEPLLRQWLRSLRQLIQQRLNA